MPALCCIVNTCGNIRNGLSEHVQAGRVRIIGITAASDMTGPLASAQTWRKAEHFHETNMGSKDAGKFLDGQRPLISVLTNLGVAK